MVKYIEATNVFRIIDDLKEQYLIFIANNTLAVDVIDHTKMKIRVNSIPVEVATVFFSDALSFVPCFQYTDSEDVFLFASPNFKFHVDSGGQYCTGKFGYWSLAVNQRRDVFKALTSSLNATSYVFPQITTVCDMS